MRILTALFTLLLLVLLLNTPGQAEAHPVWLKEKAYVEFGVVGSYLDGYTGWYRWEVESLSAEKHQAVILESWNLEGSRYSNKCEMPSCRYETSVDTENRTVTRVTSGDTVKTLGKTEKWIDPGSGVAEIWDKRIPLLDRDEISALGSRYDVWKVRYENKSREQILVSNDPLAKYYDSQVSIRYYYELASGLALKIEYLRNFSDPTLCVAAWQQGEPCKPYLILNENYTATDTNIQLDHNESGGYWNPLRILSLGFLLASLLTIAVLGLKRVKRK